MSETMFSKVRANDSAVLAFGESRQVVSTDQLRAFALDPLLVAEIATIHALGDIWAMGAAPQAGLANVVLPLMSPEQQSATLSEVLWGIERVLKDAGAELVGGHSSQGAELSIGLTVTGLCSADPVLKTGAQPDDVLLLTKPIGTGVVLAGEMRSLARGADVVKAYKQMRRPSSDAASLIAPHANAMTDVTGFGLAGHLSEMVRRSELTATVSLEQTPFMAGALDLAENGVRSSLFTENVAALGPIGSAPEIKDKPEFDLLFDPQTAGGLLAALPSDAAMEVQAALRKTNQDAWIIGRLEPRTGEAPYLRVI